MAARPGAAGFVSYLQARWGLSSPGRVLWKAPSWLARQTSSKILTNDFNLNKVAQLRGVEVLNINELANSLKPVILPGESMKIFILKEGKEPNQGVGYLDDGTMVVVDNAKRLIGKTVDVVITSVLQTTAGKMIFGKFDERVHMVHDRERTPASAANS